MMLNSRTKVRSKHSAHGSARHDPLLLFAACVALLQVAGCDSSESSESRVVLRTTQDQTEVVTMQTADGERQTVLVDAEGEQRMEVTRNVEGEYTASSDDQSMPPELWSRFDEELERMHTVLHRIGARLDGEGTAVKARATPESASLQIEPDTAAAPYWQTTDCSWFGVSNGRKGGIRVADEYGYNLPAAFTQAQCLATASSCGANPQVTFYSKDTWWLHFFSSGSWVTTTWCEFETDA